MSGEWAERTHVSLGDRTMVHRTHGAQNDNDRWVNCYGRYLREADYRDEKDAPVTCLFCLADAYRF